VGVLEGGAVALVTRLLLVLFLGVLILAAAAVLL
jgi:hypothetical protein